MHTTAYIPSFFVGFLLADFVRNTYRPVGGRENHRWLLYGAMLLNAIGTSTTSLYNSWQLLPMSIVPIFIICSRMIFHASTVLAILYIFSDGSNDPLNPTATKFEPNRPVFWYRLNRILAQLSTGYYLGNYFYIRSDFFTSRYLWNNSGFEMCKRTVSGFVGMSIMAVFLHIFFVVPLHALRKHLLHSKRNKVA